MEDILNNDIYMTIIESVAYILSAFVIMFVGKVIYNITHKSIDVKNELIEKDNFAFSVAHVGYFVGLLLAVGSAIVGPSNGLMIDLLDIGVYGVLGIILLNLSVLINDKIILRKFCVKKEIIDDQNAGTGVVEGASAVASGLIIYGAVVGEAANLMHGITTAVVFWAIGQVVLVLTSYVYNLITPYDIHEHIEKDNVAVGVGFAGAMIAIANLIRFGIQGDFVGWSNIFTEVGIDVLIGLAVLPVMRLITDKILLPGARLTDEIVNQEKPNVGAALIEAFAYIGGSVLLTWTL
ncbi:MAG: DUF350 domain-containing protein [Bacteroidales bacterium]|jgi:uncharacterized membrane protein YjfL (UPF0719 family)|nr:DUF350 domain-containing protein [Bacteroidales bacterium]